MIDSISALYHLKASDPQKALVKSCKEFESIFAHQLLKSMAATLEDGFAGEGLAGNIYDDMLYMEIARKVTEGPGLGFAKVAERQLQQQYAKQTKAQGGGYASEK